MGKKGEKLPHKPGCQCGFHKPKKGSRLPHKPGCTCAYHLKTPERQVRQVMSLQLTLEAKKGERSRS